ncbi:hypothetical protein E2C01_054047 [Portunus trituberculatus]|uniref:Uncharacterized protein n=1 Tax=Portunus trituberculatus TaxID=210409 RepID=A0A5B7GM30_PORTR|nr:hypothetical protein [Portunus trituberculatus]
MSSFSDDAEAVVYSSFGVPRVNRKDNACVWIRPWLSRRKEKSVYHTVVIKLNADKSSVFTSNNTLH